MSERISASLTVQERHYVTLCLTDDNYIDKRQYLLYFCNDNFNVPMFFKKIIIKFMYLKKVC